MNNKQRNRFIILLFMCLVILIFSSCDCNDQWRIGRDTVCFWQDGRIQIQRSTFTFCLYVDHECVIYPIERYYVGRDKIYLIGEGKYYIFFFDDDTIIEYKTLLDVNNEDDLVIFTTKRFIEYK